MGPRPIGRGNPARGRARSAGSAELQWGRDRSVAEIWVAGVEATYVDVLQWGRDRSVAEIRIAPWGPGPLGEASMGPRPIRSGNGCGWLERDARRGASKGPRPIGRGNGRPCLQRDARQGASMGPRPIGRGNVCAAVQHPRQGGCFNGAATDRSRKSGATEPSPMTAHLLQWGRDRSVAEIWPMRGPRTDSACFNGAATDRSRKFLARVIAAFRHGGASMGPRPIGRGNYRKGRAFTNILDRLQWGRDRSVAEITTICSCGVRESKLQWGRDRSVAEM